jgi:hypothetical protein
MKDVRPGFVNADLVIASASDLGPLAEALARALHPIATYRHRGQHHVRFELNLQPRSPDGAIRAFERALARLRPPIRQLWIKASRRDIDVGVEIPRSTASAVLAISDESVRLAGSLGARIVFTVYVRNGRRPSRPNKRLKLPGAPK